MELKYMINLFISKDLELYPGREKKDVTGNHSVFLGEIKIPYTNIKMLHKLK